MSSQKTLDLDLYLYSLIVSLIASSQLFLLED